MRALQLESIGTPLRLNDLPLPIPGPQQVLIKVRACGVCRTDLHVCDGELPEPKLPLILGHEIVGDVVSSPDGSDLAIGARVGVPWLGHTCGHCGYCQRDAENLCDNASFTGYQLDGGYAEYCVADSRYCLPLPETLDAAQTAPLLCAGLIGFRALRMCGSARRIGLFGFGAASHIICQIAKHEGREVYAYTRPDDTASQRFAVKLGAVWAGPSDKPSPHALDAAILFAPIGALVPMALSAVVKGGVVVCAGIHMSDIPTFPYALLWGERSIRSVANLTRKDGFDFLALAARITLRTTIETFPLAEANTAIVRLRQGLIQGAAVLIM
jgi:alcohol dehydrogenase, propanol-preferring